VSKGQRLLLTLLVIGLVGAVTGIGTFSAFSSTTSNDGNNFTAGTVNLSDNDSGTYLYNVSTAKPGDSATNCITVTYSGNLASNVKLYTTSTIGALGSHLTLTITQGTGTVAFGGSPPCQGFTPDVSGSQIYNGTLSNFASTYTGFGNGLSLTNASASTSWAQNDARVYKFVITLPSSDTTGGGLSTGTHSFTWEAQNT
jgi:predicted ribosomally synthesized peptide with SipW-like signal peptide